jgi:alkylation response protein AidB-like acyl-CoA dehydrogenase
VLSSEAPSCWDLDLSCCELFCNERYNQTLSAAKWAVNTADPSPATQRKTRRWCPIEREFYEPEHLQFRDSYRAFLEQQVLPFHDEWERRGVVDREIWREAGARGFIGFNVPEEYGGGGSDDFRFNTVISEENGRMGATGLGFSTQNDILAPYLIDLCNDEQRQRWLPGFARGDIIAAIAMTEPGAGSDLRGIRTRAVRDGDEWVIDGAKTFITNGILSDLVLVVCRTDPDAGSKGFSIIAVERDTPGFTRGRNLDKLGQHAQDTAELSFSECRVPVGNLIGDEGAGFGYLMRNLSQERLTLAIHAVGTMERALVTTLDYITQREAFGQKIGSFQNSRFVMAELQTVFTVARSFVDRCVLAHNRHELSATDAAMAKWWTTEQQIHIVDRCLQLHGGYGYMNEYPIAKMYVDSRIQTIYGGTTEIMKEIIGRSLGL